MQHKTWSAAAFLALFMLQNLAVSRASKKTPSFYTAAVLEYVQSQNCTSDPEEAKKILEFNVNFFSHVARIAKSKGADIIVFPEYGLYNECERSQTTLLCEMIPDPKQKAIPCIEEERFSSSPTIRTLSCIARNNSMVLQANVGEYLPCEGEPGCPPVGYLQFNVNIVFDRDGTLINRYRKEHLWNEYNFDTPRKRQDPKFTVDFDGIVFSTFWENTMPFGMTVEFFQSFAITLNTTVLAACIHLPGEWATGSGVFVGPYGALDYTFEADGVNKLIVSRVPRRHHALEHPKSSTTAVFFNGTTSEWNSNGTSIGEDGSEVIYQRFTDNQKLELRYHVENLENYTLHHITKPSASITECNNRMCCSLQYSTDAITETYYLAVFNGTEESLPPYSFGEEVCLLVRCNAAVGRECASFPMWSKDRFQYLNITANFSTPFVFPTVVNDHFRLVPYSDWSFYKRMTSTGWQASISFESEKGEPLLVAGMEGRLYREDPKSSFF